MFVYLIKNVPKGTTTIAVNIYSAISKKCALINEGLRCRKSHVTITYMRLTWFMT